MNGIIYYYPYENYQETRPSSMDPDLGALSSGGAGADSGDDLSLVSSSQHPQQQDCGAPPRMRVMEEEIFDVFWQVGEARPATHTRKPVSRGRDRLPDAAGLGRSAGWLCVTWQGRLVPETKLSSLPFFPAPGKQRNSRLPYNYMNRCMPACLPPPLLPTALH